jgi:two-component system response regulator RegX3
MTHVLVVEDEASFRDALSFMLRKEGYDVEDASDGVAALEQFDRKRPDLVLLDLMLPKLSGTEVCRAMRQKSNVPIIMVTAKDSEIDKVVGLELGADDYVTKPFSVKEVMARVRALLRKKRALEGEAEAFKFGTAELDFQGRTLRVDGRLVETSRKEFELLRMLIKNRGRVLARDQILNRVWGYDYYGTPRTIDNFVQKLREKVEKDAADPEFIRTVRGVGYLFDAPEA